MVKWSPPQTMNPEIYGVARVWELEIETRRIMGASTVGEQWLRLVETAWLNEWHKLRNRARYFQRPKTWAAALIHLYLRELGIRRFRWGRRPQVLSLRDPVNWHAIRARPGLPWSQLKLQLESEEREQRYEQQRNPFPLGAEGIQWARERAGLANVGRSQQHQ